MKTVFSVLFTMASCLSFGQTWYPVACNDVPPMDIWCYMGGIAADISYENEPHLFYVDTTDDNNSWQNGLSSKAFGNGVTSNLGWVTDTIASYGLGLKSDLIVTALGDMGATWISFEHRWDTDSLKDGGSISFSCDGENWNAISPENQSGNSPAIVGNLNYLDYFVHDTIPVFTGTSSDWITSAIGLQWYIPVFQGPSNRDFTGCDWDNSDTVFFKFTFESDSIETNQDGWIIRNITIGTHRLPTSIAAVEELRGSIYPNPSSDYVQIQLPATNQKAKETRIYDMMGKLIHSTVFKSNQDISFLPKGNYVLLVETDEGLYRNTLQKQ